MVEIKKSATNHSYYLYNQHAWNEKRKKSSPAYQQEWHGRPDKRICITEA